MPKWLLPTVSEILALSDPTWSAQQSTEGRNGQRHVHPRLALQRLRAEREWSSAIVALCQMLHQRIVQEHLVEPPCHSTLDTAPQMQGLVLSGPLPVLSHPDLTSNFSAWALTVSAFDPLSWLPFQLLPPGEKLTTPMTDERTTTPVLPLLPGDPLAAEQFCLVLTPWFSLVMVLGEGLTGEPAFMFSFMPEVVERVWEAIRPRILLMSSQQIDSLDKQIRQFAPVAPDYRTVMQFSRLMLEHLPDSLEDSSSEKAESNANQGHTVAAKQVEHLEGLGNEARLAQSATAKETLTDPALVDAQALDVELLQAIAHEVRTPLTTIRTLTRLLLKRKDLPPDVLKRLEIIDRECNEQIDRFGLIFRAVELETSSAQPAAISLTRTSLAQVFQQSIPRWQQQAKQRNLTLDVVLPQKMPAVVSDPSMLDKALTSLIERFTRSLPSGSHIQVTVMLAGSQLKVQLESQEDKQPCESANASTFSRRIKKPLQKSIGQMLMFQPETGSLSLNLAVTKNLFQALGGKLIVRQRPQQGEIMTVFLPLEMSNPNIIEV